MKTLSRRLSFVALVCLGLISGSSGAAEKIRVLLITGGHDFNTNEFYQTFRDNPDITLRTASHPRAQALWQAEAARDWDVLVFYDMYQPISEQAQADLVARLKDGKGLVVLHHAIANYQKWPEYNQIIGARYFLEKTTVQGVVKERSQWKHDVDFRVKVANRDHPVTRGLQDFEIHDETYNLFDVAPEVTVLLTTEEKTSGPKLAWAKTYGPARVVYLQLGHDKVAYANASYQRLLRQAIRWTAQRAGE